MAADKTLNKVCECQHAPNTENMPSLIIAYIIVCCANATRKRTLYNNLASASHAFH